MDLQQSLYHDTLMVIFYSLNIFHIYQLQFYEEELLLLSHLFSYLWVGANGYLFYSLGDNPQSFYFVVQIISTLFNGSILAPVIFYYCLYPFEYFLNIGTTMCTRLI